jgi:hypothetical protein
MPVMVEAGREREEAELVAEGVTCAKRRQRWRGRSPRRPQI